jgi:hypothetical protein
VALSISLSFFFFFFLLLLSQICFHRLLTIRSWLLEFKTRSGLDALLRVLQSSHEK